MRNAIIKHASFVSLAACLVLPAGCGSNSGNNGGSNESGGSSGSSGGSKGSGGSKAGSGGTSSGGSGGSSSGGASGSGGSGSGGAAGSSDAGPVEVPGGDWAFGKHPMKYPDGSVKLSGDQKANDDVVRAFFEKWKTAYLKSDCTGGYYLFSNGGAGADADTFLTTSEAHGYAMIVFALMNGYDPKAHEIFDGLTTMMSMYPSVNTTALMAWGIDKGCKPVMGNDSAADGDLDMAYALLLAEKIWGNAGKINYGDLAKKVIGAVKAGDMNPNTKLSKLGDYVTAADSQFYYTRASDFMIDHYRAFGKATSDAFWMGTVDNIYTLVDYMQMKFAPETGLLPDFIMNTNTPMPVQVPLMITNDPDGLAEGLNTDYDYNSCRVPWRLATDFVVTGDAKVKARLSKINAFIQKQTGGDPAKIIDGYSLAGVPWMPKAGMTAVMPGENGCFTASFGTGAVVDVANQAWVDKVWKFIQTKDFNKEDEYTNSVTLLNMIVMSGNWWAP